MRHCAYRAPPESSWSTRFSKISTFGLRKSLSTSSLVAVDPVRTARRLGSEGKSAPLANDSFALPDESWEETVTAGDRVFDLDCLRQVAFGLPPVGSATRYHPSMPEIHPYKVAVEWSGGREGAGTVQALGSGHTAPLSVPAEFGGGGAGTNPEELLAAAVAACYSITFGIIATNRKIPVASLKAEAVGEVEQAGMQFTYKAITIRPTITLEAGATDEHAAIAEDMAHKADLYCIITNAVRDKVAITVEPAIVRG